MATSGSLKHDSSLRKAVWPRPLAAKYTNLGPLSNNAIKLPCFFADFFRRQGVCTMTVKELFDFITDLSITKDNVEDYLARAQEISSNRTIDDITAQEQVDEEVHTILLDQNLQ